MSRLKTGLVACFVVCLLSSAAAWADPGFGKGLFWQVKSPKGVSSWIVGSIHVGDPRVESRIVAAEKLLSTSQRLVLEMDRQELQKAAQLMQNSQDPPFSEGMPLEMSARTRAALASRGVDKDQIDKTPRWLAILMLSMPQRSSPGMDMRLMQKAIEARRTVFGLESAREQLDSVRGLPAEIQQAILDWQVKHLDDLNYALDKLIEVYAAGNLSRLVDMEFESSAPETLSAEQQALVLDRLINQRNVVMVERMQPHLKAGRALIAIGAMHLPGVLHELDALGYTVERLEM